MIRLGEKIRALRKEKNISQEVLAEAMGVSFQAVSKWETGGSLPDVALIPALASFFDVSTDELFDYNRFQAEQKIRQITERAYRLRVERPEEAEQILREGLRQFPGNDVLLNNLLYAMEPSQQGEEMIAICKSLIQATRDDAVKYDAARILAELYRDRGELTLCGETLEEIPEIYFTKLECVARLMEGEQAEKAARAEFGQDFDRAVDMCLILCRLCREQGAPEEGEMWRRIALALTAALREELPGFFQEPWRQDFYGQLENEKIM